MAPAPQPAPLRCPRCGTPAEPGEVPAECARCGTPWPAPAPADGGARPSGLGAAVRRGAAAPLGVVAGLRAALHGVRFVARHPALWLWIVIPLLLNAVTFGALILLGWNALEPLRPDFAAQDWGWFNGLRAIVAPTLDVLMALLVGLASMLVTLMISGVINSPFYDLLSEQVESAALRRSDPGRPLSALLPDLFAALTAALLVALRQAAIMALLFLLSFTAVGAPLFVAAGFHFTGYALADVTLARKRYRASERRAWSRRHWAVLLGLGLPVNLLPPLQPFGIVGATLLYLALEQTAARRTSP